MKKYLLFLILACSLSIWSLSAQPTVTIKYAFWGNPDAIGVEKDIIEAFEASHPGIKVTPVAISYNDYHPKLQVMIAGGTAPDVMRIDSYFFQDFLKNKALKDISGLIKTNNFDTSKLYAIGMQDSMADGKFYGLPWGVGPLYMFLNTKVFADAGVPLPKTNWTYDEFVAIAKKLSKGTGESQRWGYGYYMGELLYVLPFAWGAGGDIFDKSRTKFTLNDPAVTKVLDDMLYTNVKSGAFASPFTFQKGDDLIRYFSANKLGMIFGSGATILTLQNLPGFDFAIVPAPGSAAVPNVTIYKSNVMAISASTKQEKAAWEFLSFMRGPEGEKLYMQAKRMMPTYDEQVYWNLYVDSTKPPAALREMAQEIASKYGHVLPLRSGWMEIQSLVMGALSKVVTGGMNSTKALQEVSPKIDTILSK